MFDLINSLIQQAKEQVHRVGTPWQRGMEDALENKNPDPSSVSHECENAYLAGWRAGKMVDQ